MKKVLSIALLILDNSSVNIFLYTSYEMGRKSKCKP